jgi:hypothetical protein
LNQVFGWIRKKGEKNSGSVTIGDKLSSLICCCHARGGNRRWGGVRGGHGTPNKGGFKHGEAGADKRPSRRGSRVEAALSQVTPVKQGYPGLWSWPRWASVIGPDWVGKLLCAGKEVGRAGRKEGRGGGSGPAGDSAQERFMKIIKFNLNSWFESYSHPIRIRTNFTRTLD